MTIDINELRQKLSSVDIVDHIDLHANIKPFLSEMIERLEAAEKDIALKEKIIDALGSALNAVEKERDTLHTVLEKIADWDSAWGPYPETNEAWRAMVIVTAREAVPRRGE